MTTINIFTIICLLGGLIAIFREIEQMVYNYQRKQKFKALMKEINKQFEDCVTKQKLEEKLNSKKEFVDILTKTAAKKTAKKIAKKRK